MPLPVVVDLALAQAETFARNIIINKEPSVLSAGRRYANAATVGGGVVGVYCRFAGGLPTIIAATLAGFLGDKHLDHQVRVLKYHDLLAEIDGHEQAINDNLELTPTVKGQVKAILGQQKQIVMDNLAQDNSFNERSMVALGGSIAVFVCRLIGKADTGIAPLAGLVEIVGAGTVLWALANRNFLTGLKNAANITYNGNRDFSAHRATAYTITQTITSLREEAGEPAAAIARP